MQSSSSSTTTLGSSDYQSNSYDSNSIAVRETEDGLVVAKAPRVIRHRFGLQRMKYMAKQLDIIAVNRKSKNKYHLLTELLVKYEMLTQNLGLEEAAIKSYKDSEEKVKDLVRLLTLLGKINEVANHLGSDFILNILAELRKLHTWLASKSKFNDKDRAAIAVLQQTATPNLAKIYNFLKSAIEKQYTPYLLLFVIYGMRAINYLKEKPLLDRQALFEFNHYIQVKMGKNPKSTQKLLNKKLQILFECILLADNYHQEFERIAIAQPAQKYHSMSFFNVLPQEVVEKTSTLEMLVRSLYLHSEEVIKFCIYLLNHPKIDCDEKIRELTLKDWLNRVIIYFFEIRNAAFEASSHLSKKLNQEIRLYKLVEELHASAKLDDVSYVYVHGDEQQKIDPINKALECNTIMHNLKQIKHRNLICKSFTSGNESVVLVQDAGIQEGIVIRGKMLPRADELQGRSIDQLRWRLTNTLGLGYSTQLYHMVAGTADPLTMTDADHAIERHYEFSDIVLYDKTLMLGRDLADEFKELHQQCKRQIPNPPALLALQVSFIDVSLQLVTLILQAAKYDVYLTDIKPKNFLIMLKDGKLVLEYSDNKGNQTPDHPELNNLSSAFLNATPGFHTNRIFSYQDKIKYTDLELLTREALVFSLAQLLTQTESSFEMLGQDYQIHYQFLEKNLSPESIPMVFSGILGKDIAFMTNWMMGMLHDEAKLEDLLIYFKHPVVEQRLASARAKIIMLPSPVTPENMSPDQARSCVRR